MNLLLIDLSCSVMKRHCQRYSDILSLTILISQMIESEDSPLDSIDSMNSNDFTRFRVHA